jgi:hypothetical protein
LQNTSGGNTFGYQREASPSIDNFTLVNHNANRTIDIGDYGLVTVNDSLLVTNNGTTVDTSWTFFIPLDVYDDLRYLVAYGNSTQLKVLGAPSLSSLVGMKVDFTGIGGLLAGHSLVLSMVQQYCGLCHIANKSSDLVSLWFYRYLISPYTTSNYTTTVNIPSGATTSNTTSMNAQIVSPFNCTALSSSSTGSFYYTPSAPLLEISVDRRVEITVDGYLATTEEYNITDVGPGSLFVEMGIHFTVPCSVLPGTLHVQDSSGELPSSINGSLVSVTLRYDVEQNWSYAYSVSYLSSLDDYQTSVDGLNDLKLNPIDGFNGTVDSETFSLVLPPHALLANASQSSSFQLVGDQVVATYDFHDVTPLNVGPLEFRYSEDVAEGFVRPILLTFGIFIIGLAYVIVRKIVPKSAPVGVIRVEEERARGLTSTLKEFCSDYEEKTALTLGIEKLAEDRRKGRLSKRAYMEQLEHDRRRIATLTNSINEAKKTLVPANKRYAAMIRQLETYEEERENARASLDNLELRRRQGKVSGDVYNRLKFDNIKKIEKATSGIDSVVMQLRQETL